MNNDTRETLKNMLVAERAKLEGELKSLGRKNPDNPNDWQATAPDLNIPAADPNEVADQVEEFELRYATEEELESHYRDVKSALERMEAGTYGTCEVGGEPIEEERLLANPAARTCIAHKDAVL